MDTALYFPYIQVPQSSWFTQVLLYWDQAATIVPSSLRSSIANKTVPLDPYTSDLFELGLLTLMSPDDGLPNISSRDFSQAFLVLLGPRQRQPGQRYARVHTGKMSYLLFKELRDRGLAVRDTSPDVDSWWQVEEGTADLFMAYLASTLSGAIPGMFPVTDRSESIATLAENGASRGQGTFDQKLAALRYTVISQALPAPKGPVAASELKTFKEDHAEQLKRCRRFLDSQLADLAAIEDPHQRKASTAGAMQVIGDEVAVLQEQMNKRRWPGVSLVGFGGVMEVGLAAAATAVAGENSLAVGLGLAAASIASTRGIYTTLQEARKPHYDSRAPLAYAALAGRL